MGDPMGGGIGGPNGEALGGPPGDPNSLESEAEAESTLLRNDAGASQHARFVLFSEGKAALAVLTGLSDRTCRALLGRWCKTARDDCALVHGALVDCAIAQRADPVAWITATVAARAGPDEGTGGKFDWLREFTGEPAAEPPDLELTRDEFGTFSVH
jgi:hypothetical protein